MPFNSKTASEAGKKSSRAGVPNKSTAQIREALQQIFEDNIEQLSDDIKCLKPLDRVRALTELARYVVPSLKSVEIKAGEGEFPKIVIQLPEQKLEQQYERN